MVSYHFSRRTMFDRLAPDRASLRVLAILLSHTSACVQALANGVGSGRRGSTAVEAAAGAADGWSCRCSIRRDRSSFVATSFALSLQVVVCALTASTHAHAWRVLYYSQDA